MSCERRCDNKSRQSLCLLNSLSFADNPRKGYKGCYADGGGPYSSPWGGGRTLPAYLSTDGLTVEQCAHAAALGNYEVFAMQYTGYCFLGTLADVAQMKGKLDDATCTTNPPSVNTVYSVGERSVSQAFALVVACST
jgi:hypothetical protein